MLEEKINFQNYCQMLTACKNLAFYLICDLLQVFNFTIHMRVCVGQLIKGHFQ